MLSEPKDREPISAEWPIRTVQVSGPDAAQYTFPLRCGDKLLVGRDPHCYPRFEHDELASRMAVVIRSETEGV